jgi:SagB-type dehydrogenase family enzyme
MRHPDGMNVKPATKLQTVRAYHQRTKHRFEAYAAGPDSLDWEAQPAPFRHFAEASEIPLPIFAESLHDTALLATLTRPFSTLTAPIQPLPCSLITLGAMLHLALGITAWKSYGPDRWAVRANPSSGNLHPIEGYVLAHGLKIIPDGIYHYRAEDHTLERRADIAVLPGNAPSLQIALSSVMWREAWKYGERAFRYCQLDTGHAVGALAYAASVLGWGLREQKHLATDTLAQMLGLDREADFPAIRFVETEREEAEILLTVLFDGSADGSATNISQQIMPTAWHGIASTIDAHPMYRWPVIEEVAAATRHKAETAVSAAILPVTKTKNLVDNNTTTAATVILGRRSAQRFDASHIMPKQDFFNMLDALLPCAQAPWNALAGKSRINLLLFVHRVAGLDSGLYLLVREASLTAQLNSCLDERFLRKPVTGAPAHLNLQLLTPAPAAELHRVARSLHCHQDIAANACFAVGMLAEYSSVIAEDTSAYRDLHREAGLIGQVLYLQAESHGLRGTGIGCFFDDPIHELLGLTDDTFQTIYHFTVGLALDDLRIETIATSTLLSKPISNLARTS